MVFGAAASLASAQTGRLNDTGQISCYGPTNAAMVCDAATAGDSGTRPHQDGRYGRDPAQNGSALPAKTGGGASGFDFSCVLWNGTVINGANCAVGLVANTTGTASGTPATDRACTKDNTTGLVWSLQTQTANWHAATDPSFPDTGHNTLSRCGYSNGWRVPTPRELLSIVHRGMSSGPMVDPDYFPATQNYWYWTVDTSVGYTPNAWYVNFANGLVGSADKTFDSFVRLVRSGQ